MKGYFNVKEIIKIGSNIYNLSVGREVRRMIIFMVRAFFKRQQMHELIEFFSETRFKDELAKTNPFFYEQVTRQFFYKDSTFQSRNAMIKQHVSYIVSTLDAEAIKQIYTPKGWRLWSEKYKEQELSLIAWFHGGQKKEGMLSLVLKLDDEDIYQIIFWIAPAMDSNETAIWIGAMQGTNHPNALETIKELTKYFHGYRTKNLILYMVRCFAKAMGIQKIYAVSNEGFYANNHIRINRKLKTSLDDFWLESAGKESKDSRFYELPVEEYRKSMEEVKTHKRNLYRKRFEKMDAIEREIDESIHNFLKSN